MTVDSVKVFVEGAFEEKIPNAFTPNGDKINEVFNIVPSKCIKSVARLQIFNRWGNKVFDKTNLLPQNNEGWNGLGKESILGSDVYMYIMDILFADETTKRATGEVLLLH